METNWWSLRPEEGGIKDLQNIDNIAEIQTAPYPETVPIDLILHIC